MANIIQTFPSGGAGGGHTILDTDGQAVAQESKLQFNGLSVTDDSTNGVTEVEGEGLNQDSLDDIAGAQTLVPAVIIGDANNYSTTEKVVGKWIDGKPLYQITINKSYTVSGSIAWTDTGITANSYNIDILVNGICRYPTGTQSLVLYPTAIMIRPNGNIGVYTQGGIGITHTTIQYTKTTD